MSTRRRKLAGELGPFVQQYRRKSYATHDPNDRRYDRELEAKIKRMPPEELDRLLHGDIDDETEAGHS
ncbi:hypothetical protein OJF2_34450 [Aquisphaera giovannonii]|uniref:Uncharacterized protein n=1 Tax=Aquisphaera giovannonii TaxID=406548 RepID=A0A5B9W4H9_9BACT|nr:hypothetical protein [Aquisphaera giovannonii]QEH34900.1 hypothetical protein OJF2_34450 [Aquisphaera giovannonii]